MKIFSLGSKWGLMGWSVILGFFLYVMATGLYAAEILNLCIKALNDSGCRRFWNKTPFLFGNEYINIVFWILVALVILSLIHHFKSKKYQTQSKQ